MYDELKFENCDHSKDPIVSCALEGVASIVAGIKNVSLIIHSPQGCATTVNGGYDIHEVDFTKRKIACTRLFESDIIMGAGEKLKNLIREADKSFGTKIMFVVGTCSADIIGENIEGICQNLQPEINARLIPIMAGGFRGNSYEGANMGLEALLPYIKTGLSTIPGSVNIIAPQANLNPTWWADLKWVKETLQVLGIKVQAVLAHNSSFDELEEAGRASANILLSHDVGYGFARKMENLYGIPLIMADIPLPLGLKNTQRWLRALATHFNVEEKIKPLIKDGEEMVVDILRRRGLMLIPRYRNCRVAVSADATLGISLVRMLYEELEMIPELLLFRSGQPEAKKLLEQELRSMGISPKVAFSVDGYKIKQALEVVDTDAIIGSAWEKYMAEEIGIKLAFDLINPTNRELYLDRAYFGYEGMLNILEVIANDWETAFRSKKINFD